MNTASTVFSGRQVFARGTVGRAQMYAVQQWERLERQPNPSESDWSGRAAPALRKLRAEQSIANARFVSILDTVSFASQQLSNRLEAATLADRWKREVLNPQAPWDADALDQTVEPLFEALIRLGPSAIDLRGFREEEVSGMHLAVVLRGTFAVRHQTLGWDEALGVAASALRRHNLPSEEGLVGLL